MSSTIVSRLIGGLASACVAAGMLCGLSAGAASLQVSPVTLSLQARQAADGLWLSNSGTEALHAQVRVFRWTQSNGEDVLLPTSDLIASPPMIVVQPGQRQMVRVVRVANGLNPPAIEQTYRLIIDELPATGVNTGVQFVLRYSLPVFVMTQDQSSESGAPQHEAASISLSWSVRQAGKDLILTAANNGNARAQVSAASFTPPSGKKIVLSEGLYGYVLAKSTRSWNLTESSKLTGGVGTLNALVNGEPVVVPLSTAL